MASSGKSFAQQHYLALELLRERGELSTQESAEALAEYQVDMSDLMNHLLSSEYVVMPALGQWIITPKGLEALALAARPGETSLPDLWLWRLRADRRAQPCKTYQELRAGAT